MSDLLESSLQAPPIREELVLLGDLTAVEVRSDRLHVGAKGSCQTAKGGTLSMKL